MYVERLDRDRRSMLDVCVQWRSKHRTGRKTMEHALFALPIQAGKTDAARVFLQQLEGERKGQYATSEQRLGITKEVWALQQSPLGDLFVVFFQSPNIGSSLSQFVASQDEFDQWFKRQVNEIAGVDLNVPPPGPLSEILSVYEA
jgi:hypothetical protein